MIKTQGSVIINYNGNKIKFHLVRGNFPIKPCGILGMQFLRENSATMSFSNKEIILQIKSANLVPTEVIELPARTRKLITLHVNNYSPKEGYLRKIDAGTGIFLGENLVKSEKGIVKIFAINSNLHDIKLTIPPVELEEFETPSLNNKIITCQSVSKKCILAERLPKIMKHFDFSNLNNEEKASIIECMSEFPYSFKIDGDILGATDVMQHEIHTTDDLPTFQRQYRPAEAHNEEILKQTRELLNSNLIEDSNSPYNSPVWIVPKKSDEQGNKRWRMVIDYRQLNEKTISDAYPLPNITHILDQLGGAQYFSILDLASGFHQVKMHPSSKPKTAFSTPYGHYHFNRMPFGLKNAPATFQRLMDRVLSGLQGIELFVYMDDIVIYAKSLEEHTQKLKNLLKRLESANLTLQTEKCSFLRKEVTYLGHVISRDGVKPDSKKVEAVRKFPRPKSAKNIKQFLGLAGYYRRFIPNFSTVAKPLSYLLKKGVRFAWTEVQQNAFDKLKNILCNYPILQYPNFSKPFIVSCDASNYGLGGVLSQGIIGKDLPVAYASRTLSETEINYSTIEKELLAILFCVTTFRPYLYGRKFTLVTDHRPLVWLHNIKDPGSKLLRWRLRLAEYDYDVIYKKGTINTNADALSRNPFMEIEPDFYDTQDPLPTEELDPFEPDTQNVHEVSISRDLPPVSSSFHSHLDDCNSLIEENFLYDYYTTDENETLFDDCLNRASCSNQNLIEIIDNSSDNDNDYLTASEGDEFSVLGDVAHDIYIDPSQGSESPSKGHIYVDLCQAGSLSPSQGHDICNCLNDRHDICICPINGHNWLADNLSSKVGSVDFSLDEDNNQIDNDGNNIPDSGIFLNDETDSTSSLEPMKLKSIFANKDFQCLPIVNENNVSDDENDVQAENFGLSCLRISKDKLYMRNDNLIQFIPVDCKLTTEASQELISQNKFKYDDLKSESPESLQLGNVIVYKYEEHCVFNLIIKETFDSKPYAVHISNALIGLKHAMDELKINHASISRVGNGIHQISWSFIEEELRNIFGQGNYKITICYGEIEVPPETDRLKIIEEYHSSAVGGHKGSNKTYNRIRSNFYWRDMRKDIRDFVRQCEICKVNKLVRIKTRLPMKITDSPSEAFEKIQIDIVGPLPLTEQGNKYILTIQDNLTKYSDAIPLKNIESTTIAMALAEQFISRFGCPKIIHTDQGSNFTSQIMETFCKIFKIKQLKSTAFHPQSLGSLERSHHVLIQYLKNYCEKTNWDRWIRFAIFSYNTSTHEGTGFTPHELIFGKEATIPSEFAQNKLPLTYNLFLKTLQDKLAETQSLAKIRLHAAKEKSKRFYDQKLNIQNYDVGDTVYLLNDTKSSKLDVEHSGPYKIINVFNDYNVELDIGRGKSKIVHMNKLRPQSLKIFYKDAQLDSVNINIH